MPVFEELEGLLGAEAVAKLTPEMRTKLEFGEELTSYYNGDTTEQPKPKVAARANEARTEPAASGNFDLAALDTLLEKRIGNIDEKIKAGIEEGMKTKGAELFRNATSSATDTMLGVLTVSQKHRKDFGEDFDPSTLNSWALEEQKKGRVFKNVEDAYDQMVAPKREEKRVADGIREGLKTRTSQEGVPGYTPPAANAPHRILSMRGRTEGGAGSAVSAAAADLAARRQAS